MLLSCKVSIVDYGPESRKQNRESLIQISLQGVSPIYLVELSKCVNKRKPGSILPVGRRTDVSGSSFPGIGPDNIGRIKLQPANDQIDNLVHENLSEKGISQAGSKEESAI